MSENNITNSSGSADINGTRCRTSTERNGTIRNINSDGGVRRTIARRRARTRGSNANLAVVTRKANGLAKAI